MKSSNVRSVIRVIAVAILLVSLMPVVARAEKTAPKKLLIGNEACKQWRKVKFGMFIHWGPVSLKGTEIGWSRGSQVPEAEYDQLYKRFNPTKFDAEQWVRVAKAAGMKYIVLTTKHHDGFCLWDSKYTDYDIMATPFKRDVVKELAEACRKQGIEFGIYHSLCDWYHPDYPLGSPGGRTKKATPNMPRYSKYLRNQLTELFDKYGPFYLVWFDGRWEKPWTLEEGNDLYLYLKGLQPSIIINDRVNKARSRMSGDTKVKENPPYWGDYDTPEQRIGGFKRERPWETCMTICRQWSWRPDDKMKSLEQCIQTLLRTVGGDGNLLFNVGPMPDGRIEPRQVERLREMGDWLKQYGDAVYNTRGGPFKPGNWGSSTCQGKTINLFIMKWPTTGPLTLPLIDATIEQVTTRSGGKATIKQTDKGLLIDMPKSQRNEIATVIKLTLKQNAFDIEPVSVAAIPSDSAAFGKKATASNVYHKLSQYQAKKAFDDDPETRWATDGGTKTAWLEVDLGKPTPLNKVVIDESCGSRVQQFELQYQEAGTWKTLLKGTTIGTHYTKTFPKVTAQQVRLNILKATEGPTIYEFQLMRAK